MKMTYNCIKGDYPRIAVLIIEYLSRFRRKPSFDGNRELDISFDQNDMIEAKKMYPKLFISIKDILKEL